MIDLGPFIPLYKGMKTKNLLNQGILLFFTIVSTIGCGPAEVEPINTALNIEIQTRTFGNGAEYDIQENFEIKNDGTIVLKDLKVTDAIVACLCNFQKINCNGKSSKVIISNPNKSLANYISINDTYLGKTKNQENISQAIMIKMEEAGIISINERIKDIPRFVVEAVDEEILKKHILKRDKDFIDQSNCNPNQMERFNRSASANIKQISSTKTFLSDLSACLGIDILLNSSISSKRIFDRAILFDVKTSDDEKVLADQLDKYGLTVKKQLVKSQILEISVTPQMINRTQKGLK